jgi:SAM-dependent methyltransferase
MGEMLGPMRADETFTSELLRRDIRQHYDQDREDERLRTGRGRLELWRTQDVLRRRLPAPPARVIDVGGASGVHAEWLAADGYDVELIDPVPLHVERAGRTPGVRATLGDARSLDLPDASADAVLLLGPLYHLPERADRLRALTEALRVVRPSGLVAVAAISRYASMHDSIRQGWLDEPDWVAGVEGTLVDGMHHGLRYGERNRFTTAYFHRPADLAGELREAGLTVDAVVAVEGAAAFIAGVDDLLDDAESRTVLLRWIRLTEAEPSLLGASSHLLGLATRTR